MTKLLKIKKILFSSIIILLLTSCGGIKKYRAYNFFNKNNFYNDSLNIGANFYGDISFHDLKKKKIKKIAKQLKNVSFKDVLLYGKSNMSPKYDIYVFYKKNLKPKNDTIITNELINKNNLSLAYKKQYKNKAFYLVLNQNDTANPKTPVLEDAKGIINNMRFSSNIKNELTYMKLFDAYKESPNILFVENKFHEAPIEKTKQSDWMKFQLLTTILSHTPSYQSYKDAIKTKEAYLKSKQTPVINNVIAKNQDSVYYNQNVIKQITHLSKNSNITMLNEMHWKPEHRIFAYQLLKPLKENGYNYLAIEAIYKGKDSMLNVRSFPLKSSGYYSSEPNFGLFIREAKKLGFKIVSYDDFDTDNREKAQALNIKKIIDDDPDAKIFVYAGIDHILEGKKHEKSIKRMAEYLTELTKINPLTIDQVELIATTNHELTLAKSDIFKSIKQVDTNVDYFLINAIKPTTNLLNNYGEKTLHIIDNPILKKHNNKELLSVVYLKDEYDKYKSKSIPVYNEVIAVNDNQITISLPKAKYEIVFYTKDGDKITGNIITTSEN